MSSKPMSIVLELRSETMHRLTLMISFPSPCARILTYELCKRQDEDMAGERCLYSTIERPREGLQVEPKLT